MTVFVGSVIGEWLVRNRRARCSAWEYSFHELPIFQHWRAIHKHKLNALRVLQRIVEGSFVDDARRVKNRDVRVGPNANTALIMKYWCPLFEPLRRQQRHLAQRGHQVEHFFFANVVSEHARIRPLSPWMNFRAR